MQHPEAAVGGVADLPRGERADVDDQVGAGDAELEVVDEVGAAGQEDGGRLGGDGTDGLGDVPGVRVGERLHRPAPACCTAGTMFS